jgi:monofunctional biosynthetic peptidoglycan transglycosylase
MRWIVPGLATMMLLSISMVLPFRWLNPPTTSFMLQDTSGRDPVHYEWRDWGDINIAATLAVVASEDQKFAIHHGFDLQSIENAIENYERGNSLRGASTITQQVAKNLYLWSGRSFFRKGLEAWFTVLIELCWPKKRIIEIYLNIVELGPGIYGFPAASHYFFERDAARVSDSQAALLAAVLPNPHRYQVERPSAHVRKRQRWTLGQMERLQREGWVTLLN